MNREILFRGQIRKNGGNAAIGTWGKFSGQWVYGGIFPCTGSLSIIYGWESEKERAACDIKKWTVYSDTVGQYTGLTDKNGVKIFEGDILKSGNQLFVVKYGNCGGVQNVEHEVGYVGFYLNPYEKDAEKLLRYGLRTDIIYWLNALKMEVSGNIHDNPDLLKEASNGQTNHP